MMFHRTVLALALSLLSIGVSAQPYGPGPPPSTGGSAAARTDWNVINPTNTSADETTVQAALNGSLPVFMTQGTWRICSQMVMPASQVVSGVGSRPNPGSFSASTGYSKTVVTCPTNGSFSAGQAFFALKDHSVIKGIDIYCNSGSSPPHNGINALNATSPEIANNSVFYCKNGISRFSDSAVAGFTVTYSQLAIIHGNLLYQNTDYGYYGNFAGSGFVSDEMIGPNNDFTLNTLGQVYCNGCYVSNIFSNRIEDAPTGIKLTGGFDFQIVDNNCDKIQCVYLSNMGGVAVTGNYGDIGVGGNNFGATSVVQLAGTNSNIQFAANTWQTGPVYKFDSGTTCTNCLFAESPPNAYFDANTSTTMASLIPATAGAVSAPIPAISTVSPTGSMHISLRGYTPTVSTCGTSPSVAGDDNVGTITTGSGTVTACTLTFNVPYTVAPVCGANTGTSPIVVTITTAPTTTAFTMTLSATMPSGKIFYQCIEQIPNKLTGNVGMTTGWGSARVTQTSAIAGDPLGGSTATRITEDGTASNNHNVSQNVSLVAATQYTFSTYVHVGSAGTDNIVLAIFDAGFVNNVGAVFSPSTGAFIGQVLQVGTGTLVSTGFQGYSGGWYRVWMTFSVTSQNPIWQIIYLAQGSATSFNGNSTNNVLLWGPAVRQGNLP